MHDSSPSESDLPAGRPLNKRGAAHDGPPSCPVVAVGASAGGLDALRAFLGGLTPGLQGAVVVLTHVPRDRPGHLREVLATFTSLPVESVTDETRVEPGTVYIPATGKDLTIEGGVLKAVERGDEVLRHNIDNFLMALSSEQGANAMGVILSGAGTDGVTGCVHLAKQGGVILTQDPAEASHPGMPLGVIQAGAVLATLPAAELGRQIVRLLSGGHPSRESEAETVDQALRALKKYTGHDLSGYRKGTLTRRLQKCMVLAGKSDMKEYVKELEANPQECMQLFGSLLIGVTEFFRDPEAFDTLRSKALPGMFEGKGPGDTVRVWVCGCSTGEEAYSVAILLNEFMEANRIDCGVKIFATDVDKAAIDAARKGSYLLRKQRNLTEVLIERYFKPERHRHVIVPFLRERIVMVHHNLLQDPPFLHMDLVVCRNMLIYLNQELQEKAVNLLHDALNPGGFLFLGPAESMTPHARRLEVVDKRWKLFRSTGASKRRSIPNLALPLSRDLPSIPSLEDAAKEATPARMMDEALKRRYAPPSVLVDQNHQMLHTRGDVSPYLKVPSGEPSLDILKMAKTNLRHHLRMALDDTARTLKPVIVSSPRVASRDKRPVTIGVDPVLSRTGQLAALLVVFESKDQAPAESSSRALQDLSESGIVLRYESELQNVYDQLRHVVEKDESLHEELRASNEELLSMNEELQSANEEMDASREELQSLNEELSIKVDELSKAYGFVENLLQSTNVATIFLDNSQRIVRSTPTALDVFHLAVEDQGRPIAAIKSRVHDDHMLKDIHRVMLKGREVEREVEGPEGRNYLKRVFPFRTSDGVVDGVVMTYSDITTLKEAERVLRRGREELRVLVEQRTAELQAARQESERRARELEAVMEQTPAAIWITRDTRADVILGNPASYSILGLSQNSNVSKSSAAPPDYRPTRNGKDIPVDQLPLQRAAKGEVVKGEEIDIVLADGSVRTIMGNAVPMINESGEPAGAVGVFLDFTTLKQERQARHDSETLFKTFMDNSPAIAWMKDEDGRHVYLNEGFQTQFGTSLEECLGKTDQDLWPAGMAVSHREVDGDILKTGKTISLIEQVSTPEGGESYWHKSKFLVTGAGGKRFVGGVGVDITERILLERQLRNTADRLVLALESATAGTWEWIVASNENIWSESIWTLYGLDPETDPACYETWKRSIHPDFRDAVEREVLSALAEKREINIEWRVNLPDGERWMVSRGKPVLRQDGEVERYLGIALDITDRKKAEEALRVTLDSIQDGFIALDSGWRFVYVNSTGEKLMGMKRADLIGKSHWEVFPLTVGTDLEKEYRLAASGEPRDFQNFYEPWQRWFHNRCFPREGGGMSVYFEDITGRKKIEQEFQVRQEQFRLFAEHAPASIAMFDTDMRYMAVSNRWLEEFKLTGQNLIGRSHYEVFPEIPERWKAVHRRCLDGAVERADADPFLREDGTTQWISWEVRPWYKSKNEIGGIVFFSQDVTIRKNYENFINASLKEKEVLLKEIHHRVKNNLQIIASLLSLREQTVEDAQALDVLAESRSRVMSMALIHNQLYQSNDFSEIDAKSYLEQLLPRLVAAYKGDKDINLTMEVVPLCLSLDQAIPFGLIMNELVTNALKHGFKDRAGGILSVSARIAGVTGEIEVKDDGQGLPEGFRMSDTKTLGLQIVGMLVDQIHGGVAMESGEGTKVTLRFPLANPSTN